MNVVSFVTGDYECSFLRECFTNLVCRRSVKNGLLQFNRKVRVGRFFSFATHWLEPSNIPHENFERRHLYVKTICTCAFTRTTTFFEQPNTQNCSKPKTKPAHHSSLENHAIHVKTTAAK